MVVCEMGQQVRNRLRTAQDNGGQVGQIGLVRVQLQIERSHELGATPDWAQLVAEELGWPADQVRSAELRKRALDARRGRPKPTWSFTIDAELSRPPPKRAKTRPVPTPVPELLSPRRPSGRGEVAVVGAGPAGLFAALHLLEHGAKVRLIDRGKPVRQRARDFGRFRGKGELDTESNLCFGEGGAGTYSDGKLTCRRKDPMRAQVLKRLVEFGGPPHILVDAKPHVGTNLLFRILESLHAHLEDRGVIFDYGARVDGLKTEGGRIRGLRMADGSTRDAEQVVLAMGHSARELFESLHAARVPMTPKAFAVGVRIEHPQALVDAAQYKLKDGARPDTLPPADYRLAHTEGERGVYSFCMCPGGMVVPTATEPETVVVNGMSSAKRGSPFANSGLVVQVHPGDVAAEGFGEDALAGLRFQRSLEQRAYALGGGGYRAPAVRIADFAAGRTPGQLAGTHFRPGLTPADLDVLFPAFVRDGLRAGIQRFDRQLKGYASNEGNLIGVESRTSSPLRIERDEGCQVPGFPGLFVAGEGPGYAGGIMSAALDGLRVAHALLSDGGGGRT